MNPPLPLSEKILSRLPSEIVRPTYDRSRVKTGIVHVGVGGFHRSHEAFYTDRLLQSENASEWGICGVGLRDADRKMATLLKQQDYLYTLLVKDSDGNIESRVIGSIVDYMMGCDDPAAVIDRMAHPETKIVSLTITEGGYNVDAETGEFDTSNPDAQHDVRNPSQPRLVFGFLTAALQKRRKSGLPPFTIQSCDNIQHNGDLTRKMLVGFARLQDEELAGWIERDVSFPNAMVDRITPVTTEADIEYLRSQYNLRDDWPVVCEPFCQWVVEDCFSNGRPNWQDVGVQFVPDVSPYEKMKLRLLNAGHSVLGILGSVFGYQTIDECVGDDLFRSYLRQFFDREATPVLDDVEGIDLDEYKATLIQRFGNPNIRDHLARICLESSSKLPVFLIPTIRENLARGGSIQYAAFVVATWCYYSDKQADRHGQQLDVKDAFKSELHRAATATSENRLSFLKFKPVFGDLAENERFAKTYTEMIDRVYRTPDVTKHMRAIMANEIGS
ncbi:mannitol dehydrogenase family protein [Allorhodopirellula heiligendammensis]|uniref:Mannitol 2-dehydrogenase n=1 Tax=Allorhodopirellula heiligendammensis TaxID=2714739 RepID=A0A5C6BVN6_9BACT|nr:mannitol dehydrogenase family protein [Allorhodopirellula heiligendammensis]TWU15491.1 Mannitol 2-dehydrogenase [Allorhodopirellula heiligendammensis]